MKEFQRTLIPYGNKCDNVCHVFKVPVDGKTRARSIIVTHN